MEENYIIFLEVFIMLHSILAIMTAGMLYAETANAAMKDLNNPVISDIAYVHNVYEYQDEQDYEEPNSIHIGFDIRDGGWFCYDDEGKIKDFMSLIVETNRHSES